MTKVKIPPEDRIYDVDGYWLRAACVCVKDQSETEVSFAATILVVLDEQLDDDLAVLDLF